MRLTWSYKRRRNCTKHEVYFAKSLPPGKIRGVQGITGKIAGKFFTIVVETDTKGIYLEMAGYGGQLARRYFAITRYLAAAKREKSGWQKAWKRSERRL